MSHDGKQPANETPPPASRRRPTAMRRLELKLLRKMGFSEEELEMEHECPFCREEWLARVQEDAEE